MSTIDIQNLYKEYPNKNALDGINLKISVGKVHGLLGQNGAGKTTLMRILAGLIVPTQGQVVWPRAFTKGVLFEHPPLYLDMRVNEYLVFVARIFGIYGKLANKACDEVLQHVGLTEQRQQIVGILSRGQKQKLALAQALIHQPELLILDEPTVALDPLAVMEIRELIKGLKGKHTVIVSTHILSEVDEICDEFSIIHHGRILHSGKLPLPQKAGSSKSNLENFFKSTILDSTSTTQLETGLC